MRPEELDDLDAIHRDATSLPWDDEWDVVEEPDEYGYYPQREVRAEKDGQSIATFAYLQHLELFLAALKLPKLTAELRTLRDLAHAVRREHDVCAGEHCRVCAVLARLDGETDG